MFKSILTLSLTLNLLAWGVFQNTSAQDSSGITYVLDLAWSPDGTRIAAAGIYPGTSINETHGYLTIVDAVSGNTLINMQPPSAFTSVAWSPDGKRLALGSYDGTVWVVDAANGEWITSLFGHQATVTDVDWNSTGTQIVSSGNWDKLVILWDAVNYTPLAKWEVSAHPNAIEFGANDGIIAVGTEGGLFLFSPETEPNSRISQDRLSIDSWILDFAYSHDGRYLASGSIAHISSKGVRDKAQIVIYDLATRTWVHQFESVLGSIGGIAWSADDQTLAVLNDDNVMTLWDVETGMITASYPSYGVSRPKMGGVAYSPYGGRLAFTSWLDPSASEAVPTTPLPQDIDVLANGAVQIVVPAPSLERLAAIQSACATQTDTVLSFAAPQTESDLDAYIAQVEASAELPPACAADLIAVAEALQARE